jgi:dynein assembly factor with WDR repeat domains 1
LAALSAEIVKNEPLLSESRKPQIKKLLDKLVERMATDKKQVFHLFKMLRAHILPLTNCAFNKSGDK